ncbi:ergosterol biosynthesis ERG4/ERG24 family-domain-containing protein [Aspergillus alliaceus]|uniref:ergosterol biosynthesis ERG4/ERG24 family-domain-containing protein n=1 Tax=Petromyces alliaceus TaxID=209559 RepID=UPI0012A54C92|nr:ergosterol biosynthesis ERG4/ERG24 family-domain-containing protein [Aspergillus alliaceus]KAB8231647.1 ergosterol biosynthesis ERG4/ERG24 family-domain-containing protein [Aspergillus alliaceus]
MLQSRIASISTTKYEGNRHWGRRMHVTLLSGFLSLTFVLSATIVVLFVCTSLSNFNGSLQGAFAFLPIIGYGVWLVFQAALSSVLPGKIAHRAPNSRRSLFALQDKYLSIIYVEVFQAIVSVARYWAAVLMAANMYGLLVSVLALLKGYIILTSTQDRRLNGSVFHDLLAGLFQIGWLGMNLWVVIGLCIVVQQRCLFCTFSNSMALVIRLHQLYIADFLVNEKWYLWTIGNACSHFGFYLGWGSAVWLSVIYTTQAQYLASHPVHPSPLLFIILLVSGILSYILFRLSNHQRYHFRKTTRVIWARYTTSGSKSHESLLLFSGFWGIVRYPNYDERRCPAKYGLWWKRYKQLVCWWLIPGLF